MKQSLFKKLLVAPALLSLLSGAALPAVQVFASETDSSTESVERDSESSSIQDSTQDSTIDSTQDSGTDSTLDSETEFGMAEKVEGYFSQMEKMVEKAEKSGNTKDIANAIDSFSTLMTTKESEEENLLQFDIATKDERLDGIFNQMMSILKTNKTQKDYFVAKMVLHFVNDRAMFNKTYIDKIVEKLDSDDPMNKKILESYQSMMFILRPENLALDEDYKAELKDNITYIINRPKDPEIPVIDDPMGGIPEEVRPPDYNSDLNPGKPGNSGDGYEFTWEETETVVIDGKEQVVTVTKKFDKNGKIVEVSRVVGSPETSFMEDYNYWMGIMSQAGIIGSGGESELLDADGLAPAEDRSTLTYTIDKGSKKPVYINSGINVDKDGASFTEVQDLLRQISSKIKADFMEDKDKFLLIVEKKAIIITKKHGKYTQKDLTELFKASSSVGVKIEESNPEKEDVIEEQIKNASYKFISVNGSKTRLQTSPVVKDQKLLIPIREVGGLLGLQVIESMNKEGKSIVELQKGQKSVTFEEGLPEAKIKKSEARTVSSPERDDKGFLMVDLTSIADVFDIEMKWDSEDSVINFSTTTK